MRCEVLLLNELIEVCGWNIYICNLLKKIRIWLTWALIYECSFSHNSAKPFFPLIEAVRVHSSVNVPSSAWSRQCIWSFANLPFLKPQFSSFKVAIVTSILAREAKYSSLWDHYENHCMKKPAGRCCEWVGSRAPSFFS